MEFFTNKDVSVLNDGFQTIQGSMLPTAVWIVLVIFVGILALDKHHHH